MSNREGFSSSLPIVGHFPPLAERFCSKELVWIVSLQLNWFSKLKNKLLLPFNVLKYENTFTDWLAINWKIICQVSFCIDISSNTNIFFYECLDQLCQMVVQLSVPAVIFNCHKSLWYWPFPLFVIFFGPQYGKTVHFCQNIILYIKSQHLYCGKYFKYFQTIEKQSNRIKKCFDLTWQEALVVKQSWNTNIKYKRFIYRNIEYIVHINI